jgi:sn-glycerol 3-phosphate transport system substrate-binding protein
MGGKKPDEYKGVAKFFTFLSQTSLQQELHEVTGYLPMTKAAYAVTRASGFYDKNPGREIPVIQMTAKPPTENSRELRLGNQVQIRDIIAEELEAAFAGKQDALSALDDAVKRGNGLLRQFERTPSSNGRRDAPSTKTGRSSSSGREPTQRALRSLRREAAHRVRMFHVGRC